MTLRTVLVGSEQPSLHISVNLSFKNNTPKQNSRHTYRSQADDELPTASFVLLYLSSMSHDVYPVPGSEIVGPAELRKPEDENKTPSQLFACLLLSRHSHYLITWNFRLHDVSLEGKSSTADVIEELRGLVNMHRCLRYSKNTKKSKQRRRSNF